MALKSPSLLSPAQTAPRASAKSDASCVGTGVGAGTGICVGTGVGVGGRVVGYGVGGRVGHL